MDFQLGEIRAIKEPLVSLVSKELPIKSAWKLNKFIKAIEIELAGIEETRVKLVTKYGEKDEEDNIQVPQEAMPDFVNEFNEFLTETVVIDYDPLEIDSLGDITVSPLDMTVLDRLFV